MNKNNNFGWHFLNSKNYGGLELNMVKDYPNYGWFYLNSRYLEDTDESNGHGKKNSDGSGSWNGLDGCGEKDSDGRISWTGKDGSRGWIDPDGSGSFENSDGYGWFDSDGTGTWNGRDGSYGSRDSNGCITWNGPNGHGEKSSDGSGSWHLDGESEGKINFDGSGIISLYNKNGKYATIERKSDGSGLCRGLNYVKYYKSPEHSSSLFISNCIKFAKGVSVLTIIATIFIFDKKRTKKLLKIALIIMIIALVVFAICVFFLLVMFKII